MNKKLIVVLMGLANASSGVQAMGPLNEGAPLPDQASFSPGAAAPPPPTGGQTPDSASQPANLSQRKVLQPEDLRQNGVVQQDNLQRKIPEGFLRRKEDQSLNKRNLRGAKKPLYGHIELPEEMPPADKCKAQRACRGASTRGIQESLEDMQLIHSLPRGAKVERLTLSLETTNLVDFTRTSQRTLEEAEKLEAIQREFLRRLRRIKDLDIEHLEVKIDWGKEEVTQTILEWVQKNPYRNLKSLKIKALGELDIEQNLRAFLPSPRGSKVYKPKNLQKISIFAPVNLEAMKIIEQYTDVEKFELSPAALPFEPAFLEAFMKSSFPSLRTLALQTIDPVVDTIEEIKKTNWANQLTAFYLGAKYGDHGGGRLDFSGPPFAGLKELKLFSLGKTSRHVLLLQNAPDLQSFEAYECVFDLTNLSAFLERLAGKLMHLKLEAVSGFMEGKRNYFCHIFPQVVKSLHSFTLKNCLPLDTRSKGNWMAGGARLEEFFGDHASFEMHSLDLSGNEISMRAFETVFSKKFPNLKNLDISSNILGAESVKFLIRNHTNFPKLQRLTLSKRFFKPMITVDEEQCLTRSEAGLSSEFEKVFLNAKILWEKD